MWFPLPDAGPLSSTGSSLASTLDGVEIQGTLDIGKESRRGSDMFSESQMFGSCVKKVIARELGGAETPHAETGYR